MARCMAGLVWVACGAPQRPPPSTRGDLLTVPPSAPLAHHQPGVVRFRQTALGVGPQVPLAASGSRVDYELHRAGSVALLVRDSYELVAGAWTVSPGEHLRERLTVSQLGDVMRLSGPGDAAAVECHRQRARVHPVESVATLRCNRADRTDPKAAWSAGLEDLDVWSCRSTGDLLDRTWIGGFGPIAFSEEVDLESLAFTCLASTDAPIPDFGERILAR